jgi:two-component system response regulator PilR (NtrC family)
MPISLQAKLLRVLENGTFRRVGGVSDTKVDVRVISATNRDLSEGIAAGGFREDLFYRLNVVPVHLPPLRERTEDIPLFLEHFLQKLSPDKKEFSPECLRLLMKYPWKGNVRELENMVERIVLLADRNMIMPDDLPEEVFTAVQPATALPDVGNDGVDLEKIVEEIEKDYLGKALTKANGNKTDAAKLLNLSFRSFRHRLHKYGM